MKSILIYSFIIASAIILLIWFLISNPYEIVNFYGEKLRASLFAGFLTVGGFLFSLKTFIIIKMKEEVYENKKYYQRLEEHRTINKNISHYGPLKRLSHLLFFSVLSSFITATVQFTLGLIENFWMVLICIWCAIFSLFLLIYSLFIIKKNLDDWFEFLEETNKEQST